MTVSHDSIEATISLKVHEKFVDFAHTYQVYSDMHTYAHYTTWGGAWV